MIRTVGRLIAVAATVSVGSLGLAACHEPQGPWTECYNTRPHPSIDNVGGNSAAIFRIIYSCRLRHGSGDLYDVWCIGPDGHEIIVCAGPQGGLDEGDVVHQVSPERVTGDR